MSPDGAPEMTSEQLQALVAQHMTVVFHQTVPHVPGEHLLAIVERETAAQEQYTPVLEDLTNPEAQASHPLWGFSIVLASDPAKRLSAVTVPKVLNPGADVQAYLGDLANWTAVYSLATTPAARAAWIVLGFRIEFFQTKPQSALIV